MGLFFEDQQPEGSKYYPTLREAPQKNIIGRINDGLYGLVEGGEYGLTSLAGGILGAGGKLVTLGLSKAMTGNADLELGKLVERKINGSMIREPLTEAGKIWQGELENPGSILGSKPTSVMSFIPDVTTELTDKFINEPWNLGPVSREVVNTVSPFLVPGGKAVKTAGDIGTLKKVKTISGDIDFYIPKAPGETYSAVPEIPTLVSPEAGRFKLIDENTPSTDGFKFVDEEPDANKISLRNPEIIPEKTTKEIYQSKRGIERYKDGDVVGRISPASASDMQRLGFDTKESNAIIPQGSIDYINESHGKQLKADDIDYLEKTINEPTEILPNLATPDAPHRSASVLMVRKNGKDYVSIVEITKGDKDNIVWNFWKMGKHNAENYLKKFREEKARILQSGGATAPIPHIPHNTPEGEVGKPEGLSGSQTEKFKPFEE